MKVNEILSIYENYMDLLLERSIVDDFFTPNFLDLVEKHNGVSTKVLIDYLNNIRLTFRRKDRIVWLFRLIKLMIIETMINSEHMNPELHRYRNNELKKYNTKARTNYTWSDIKEMKIYDLGTTFNHFFSLGIPAIDNHIFTYDDPILLEDMFSDIERQYISKAQRFVDITDTKVFLKINDKIAWYDLERPYCSDEADAMGHCGNAPDKNDDNQTILSLRKKTSKGFKPLLTFIYHKKEKALGEMKGFRNQKPSKKYHPYILKLIMDYRIKTLKGGGYKPKNNFSLNDLDEKTKKNILNKKPNLMS